MHDTPEPGPESNTVHRRDLLRWLAASPLLGALAGCDLGVVGRALAQEAPARSLDDLVASAQEALDVFDLEKVAAQTVPTAHWGYIKTGVDGEGTQASNRASLERIYLRARRLVDVSNLDMRVSIFGREWPTPLMIAPAGSLRLVAPPRPEIASECDVRAASRSVRQWRPRF